MLVAWKYRERKSIIQWFDPRAWLIFFACFLFSTLSFWDVRYLLFFFAITMFTLFNSGVTWKEMRRAFIFIIGFVFFFAILTFLTGRGGGELYGEEHLIREFRASFSIFGWTPTLKVTVERAFFAVSQLVRVSSIAVMTILIPYSLNPAHYGITFKGLGLNDKIAYAMHAAMNLKNSAVAWLSKFARWDRSLCRWLFTPLSEVRISSMPWIYVPLAWVHAHGSMCSSVIRVTAF